MSAPSLIFLTTQTSATESIWRILTACNEEAGVQGSITRHLRHLGHEVHIGLIRKRFSWYDVPREMVLVHHNIIHVTEGVLDPGNMKFIINFRDPRDVHCNQYYWQNYHKNEDNDEQFQERLKRIQELGIDRWVINRLPSSDLSPNEYYNKFLATVDKIPVKNFVVATYARNCLDFDSFIQTVLPTFPVTMTNSLSDRLERERPNNLMANPQWVGGRWIGADIAPGRYKRELMPETIRILNTRYKNVLRKMAELDRKFSDLYMEGI